MCDFALDACVSTPTRPHLPGNAASLTTTPHRSPLSPTASSAATTPARLSVLASDPAALDAPAAADAPSMPAAAREDRVWAEAERSLAAARAARADSRHMPSEAAAGASAAGDAGHQDGARSSPLAAVAPDELRTKARGEFSPAGRAPRAAELRGSAAQPPLAQLRGAPLFATHTPRGARASPPASGQSMLEIYGSAASPAGVAPPPPLPPSRTNWTRLVPLPVLTGHVSSLLPY